MKLIELHDFDHNKIETPAPIYQPDDENVKQFATYNGRVFTLQAWSGMGDTPIVYYERPALLVHAPIDRPPPESLDSEAVN